MKKLIILLLSLFMFSTTTYASEAIEVQATMLSRSNAQDRVWVGTFQLVWNDFIEKFVHNPVRFREGTPITAQELNQKTFSVDDISEKCYYKYSGKITKNTKKQIEKAIKKKFKETSDILDKLDLTPRNDKFLIYAMLKKDFEFLNEFDKLGKSDFGEDNVAEYFGIDAKSKNALGKGVTVLFYNSPKDFAVKLATKDNDEVYLYKNPSNKPFKFIYEDMNKKIAGFNGEKEFSDTDELKVPNIKFFAERNFEEFEQKRVMGTNMIIEQAIETVKFNMNNKGVELKSEAAMTIMKTALLPEDPPRYFYLDDTFVIFLKEKNKNHPYFALRVHDISKFQK